MILIAGFGNVLRGDDGFGVEVVKRLACSALPPSFEILEVGIGGTHFIFKLWDKQRWAATDHGGVDQSSRSTRRGSAGNRQLRPFFARAALPLVSVSPADAMIVEADRLGRSPMDHAAIAPAVVEITRLIDILSA
jgi:hypothetical protein